MSHLVLCPERLLWRTRGRAWDYLYLCRPVTPALPGWHDLFDDVFPDANSGPHSDDRRGTRTCAGIVVAYAAMAVDALAQDEVGRTIRHYFLYALDPARTADPWPTNWGELLRTALTPTYQAAFGVQRGDESPLDFTQKILAPVRRAMPAQIVLGGEAGR